MKKHIPALLLAICMFLTVPALAVEDSTENFTRTKTYTDQFSDLTKDSVFYDNVSALYEYGLSVGKGDGTYGLKDSLTVGQAVIFAGRVRSLYRTGDPESGPAAYSGDGDLAALPYLRYLQAEGVLDTALDNSLTSTATRAQMAHILANILPEEALPPTYSDLVTEAYNSNRFITDVMESTPYCQDILTLYRTGVCVGSDATGSFLPDQAITRGAVAAMLTRMLDPDLRVGPQWQVHPAYSAEGTTLADLVTPGTYIADPVTAEEMDSCIRYMLASGSNQLELQYDKELTASYEIVGLALSTVKTYCEQSYNRVAYNFEGGYLKITFSAECAKRNLSEYRTAAMEAAIAVHDQLWEDGQINDSMSELEKARVYYTWICEHCTYDHDAGTDSFSHIPYSLFQNGIAVCDGYTGAYNMLLKLEGIDCTALANKTHIWTVATLDGTEYHIDTTWGGSRDTVNYDYFAMTADQSWQYHAW